MRGDQKSARDQARFNSPSCIEALKRFIPSFHTCIIFDEVDLRSFPRETVIALVDFEEESDFRVTYGVKTVPAGTKKIVISNEKDIWPASDAATRTSALLFAVSRPIMLPTSYSELDMSVAGMHAVSMRCVACG